MYQTIKELLTIATEKNVSLSHVILLNEIKLFDTTEEQIFEELEKRYTVMELSAKNALKTPHATAGSLIEGITKTQYEYATQNDTICGEFLNLVMARALSSSEINASMGKVCAAPTAGACGIVPAVLVSLSEKYKYSRRKTLEGLLCASGIGAVITKNATVSGAEGGCQAECGVAAAMAAAAAVELTGGTNEQAVHAVSFALMNCMGLVCDPVAGLVQVPCAQRNASQALNALLSADLAKAGMKSVIPADEVIDAMFRVGKLLPYQLKETAQGGIAATPTGKKISKQIFK